jgi:hypothetical protein
MDVIFKSTQSHDIELHVVLAGVVISNVSSTKSLKTKREKKVRIVDLKISKNYPIICLNINFFLIFVKYSPISKYIAERMSVCMVNMLQTFITWMMDHTQKLNMQDACVEPLFI